MNIFLQSSRKLRLCVNTAANHHSKLPATDRLVAHRGDCRDCPENSIAAVTAALEAGARLIEIDVQFSADRIPLLFHDRSLERMTGVHGSILDTRFAELPMLQGNRPTAGHSDRERFPISRLSELINVLRDWPSATAFIEIKEASLQRFGIEEVVDAVMEAIAPVYGQCIPISFNCDAMHYARYREAKAIGWVIRRADDLTHRLVDELAPEYLFCEHTLLPAPLWKGKWQWVTYEVTTPELALELWARGVRYIETMDIRAMLNEPRLRSS